jgi:uncharacterized protein (TIGR00255 family)
MTAAIEKSRAIRSMTGYARTRRQTTLGELTISVRTVNHRSMDFHFHQASEIQPFEAAVRKVLKQHITRGHVEVRIALSRPASVQAAVYNREIVGRYVAAVREAAIEFGVPGEPDLNAALRLPGAFLVEGTAPELEQSFEPELVSAVEECAAELNRFREREGAELQELLRAEAACIEKQADEMKVIRSEATPQFQARLGERLQALLGDAGPDPRRLIEEAALLADRSDVAEELSRLEIHTAQLLEMLEAGGEVGKRLDFLLQEMNRETNTILSKTSGIGELGLRMSDLALATKANIERIREQALNLE